MKKINKKLTRSVMAMVLGGVMGMGVLMPRAEAENVDINPSADDKLNEVSNNSLVIGKHLDGTADDKFAYAYNGTTAAETASWSLSDTDAWGTVYGGYATGTDSNATNNKISIGEGTITVTNLYGGYSVSGSAENNTTEITGGIISGVSWIISGYAKGTNADAINNKISISKGTINGNRMYVALSISGSVENNLLEIKGGTISGVSSLISGFAYDTDKDAINNKILITGGDITGSNLSIRGGESNAGSGQNNLLEVKGGTIKNVKELYGCFAVGTDAVVSNNKVLISGGEITGIDTGLWVRAGESLGSSDGNITEISGGTLSKVRSIIGAFVQGKSTGDAKNNKVLISGGSITGRDAGFKISGALQNSTNTATNNVVEITGGTIAGTVDVSGSESNSGSATNNTVLIGKDAKFTGTETQFFGGLSRNLNYTKGTSPTPTANGNTITVYGGSFENNTVKSIVGGAAGAKISGTFTTDESTISAKNNTVEIANIDNLTVTNLYGGAIITGMNSTNMEDTMVTSVASVTAAGSGNALILGAKNITATNVGGFENYTFNIPTGIASDAMLKITADKELSLADLTINVDLSKSMSNKGDTLTLVEMESAKVTGLDTTTKNVYGTDGIVNYAGEIRGEEENADGFKKVVVETDITGLDPDGSKAPVEGMAAAASAINTSTDLTLGAGISNLITSTAGTGNTTDTFAAGSYGKSKLNTGSHVDIRGYDIVVGIGRKVFSKNGNKTTGGLFFEYGNNDYDTYNNGYNGDGKSVHKGGGYIMRWDNKSGNYYEGMIHAGKITNNWNNGANWNYEMSPTYYGGAATYGHKFMLGEDKQLSIYGSYIYNHIGGGDAKISGHEYDFDATNSHRTKVGVRYAMSDLMDTKKFRPYIGLAWEHEFDGESGATIEGAGRTLAPSMKGDSGIFELGFNQEVGKWTLGLGAELFTGKRRGWNGTLKALYNF